MIENSEKKKLEDGLEVLLRLQGKFQKEHGFEFWNLEPGKRRDMLIRQLFAAISELSEAGDEVNKWWKKGSKEPEALEQKREQILEEMVDSLHFFLSSLLTMKVSAAEVSEMYLKKLGVNFERQKNKQLGYV